MPQFSEGETMEECSFSGDRVSLPTSLVCRADVFKDVLSFETWTNKLTSEERASLSDLLPQVSRKEQDKSLRDLFSGKDIFFGSPLMRFQQQLSCGDYHPQIQAAHRQAIRDGFKDYKHRQRRYFRRLIEELLVKKESLIASMLTPGVAKTPDITRTERHQLVLTEAADVKYRKMLLECRQEANVADTSSDEDDLECLTEVPGTTRLTVTPMTSAPRTYGESSNGVNTNHEERPSDGACAMTGLSNGSAPTLISQLVTDEDYANMIRKHKKRRCRLESHPELNTDNTTLNDILGRCQMAKRPKLATKKHSVIIPKKASAASKNLLNGTLKGKLKGKPGKKNKLQQQQQQIVTEPPTLGPYSSFFALIRQIFCDCTDSRTSLHRLEEKVLFWQHSDAGVTCNWVLEEEDWTAVVLPALRYLAAEDGAVSSFSPVPGFVPMVDFKDRIQQWKWVGSGRDSDQTLKALCNHFLATRRDIVEPDMNEKSPPPPITMTDYVVRPSTGDEKSQFQVQETRRYSSAHRSFTYRMHGYDSVVGPVKGVFNKDSGLSKAREHPLLISNRPACVTILSIVRDAAARLPNGEGTRAEICVLVRDSQYIAPTATDQSVHTVVSGALDRLHYEKDPCVRYDSNRKLWVYLHRNRSEDEFETLHQASAAALRAKKQLLCKAKGKSLPATNNFSMAVATTKSGKLHGNSKAAKALAAASKNAAAASSAAAGAGSAVANHRNSASSTDSSMSGALVISESKHSRSAAQLQVHNHRGSNGASSSDASGSPGRRVNSDSSDSSSGSGSSDESDDDDDDDDDSSSGSDDSGSEDDNGDDGANTDMNTDDGDNDASSVAVTGDEVSDADSSSGDEDDDDDDEDGDVSDDDDDDDDDSDVEASDSDDSDDNEDGDVSDDDSDGDDDDDDDDGDDSDDEDGVGEDDSDAESEDESKQLDDDDDVSGASSDEDEDADTAAAQSDVISSAGEVDMDDDDDDDDDDEEELMMS